MAGVVFAIPAILLSAACIPWLSDGSAVKWLVLAASLPLLAFVPWIKFDRIDWTACALFGWAAVTLLWTPDPLFGAERLAQCLILLCLFLGLRRFRADVRGAVALAVTVALISTEILPNGTFQGENFITEFVLLALPFAGAWCVLLAPLVALFLWANPSHIEWAAFAALAGGFVSLWLGAKLGRAKALWSIAGLGIVAVIAAWQLPFGPIAYRIDLTLNTLVLWITAPIGGVGLGGFDYLYPTHMVFQRAPAAFQANEFVGAAHNDMAQLLAELGLVGAGLTGRFLWMILKDVRAMTPALAVLAMGAGIAAIEFPLQMPGTGALIAWALATLSPALGEPIRWPRWGVAAIGSALSIAAVFTVIGHHFFAVTRSFINDDPVVALMANAKAYDWAPWDKQIRLQYFSTLAQVQRMLPAEIERDTAESIFTISKSAIPENPQLLIDRIAYLSRAGRCEDECRQIALQVARQPNVAHGAALIEEFRSWIPQR